MRALVFALFLVLGCAGEPEVVDDDGDGYGAEEDCDDGDDSIHPDAAESCNGLDDDCDGEVDEGVLSTFHVDGDGDGYGGEETAEACEEGEGLVSNATDCDDTRADVHPGAEELCDGADNNCQGQVDEGVTTTFYVDADGDGYGVTEQPVEGCEPGEGEAEVDGDCDDADEAIHPAADEVCDEVDNDCDGTVDEGSAVDATTWYRDADEDGYGDPTDTWTSCEQPPGRVDNGDDCDDADDRTYPGAWEYCDGEDDDCDGTVDEDDALDAPTWYEDGDGDGYGDPVGATVVQCSDPGAGWSGDDDDCDDDDDDVSPGADELCNEIDDDCDGDVDEDDAVDALTWYGDLDGDGYGNASNTTTACEQPTLFVADDSDCDDTDDAVNPAATEVCDEVDNDCDGTTDEDDASDAPTWYADTDGDGFGDADTTDVACDQPSGYVADATDCDDTDDAVYPGADETCDDADEDCDGDVDEDAIDGDTWYADADGDSYGDPATSTVACDEPTGYVSDDSDCDDTDAAIHPDTTWYPDFDSDGYGDATSSYVTVQCTAPYSTYVTDGTDCDDGDDDAYPGADEICLANGYSYYEDGVDNDCDGDVDEGCPELHYSKITSDETWTDNGVGHLVTMSVLVEDTASSSGPVLTIEDGAEIAFWSGTGLYAGVYDYGDIVIEGTTLGVVMTSAETSPAPGDWVGLVLDDYADASSIEGLEMSYAGSYYRGAALFIEGDDTTVTDSSITYSSSDGIYAGGVDAVITGTEISDNDGVGLSTYTGLVDTADSFSGNTLTGNGSYPLEIAAELLVALADDNSFSGNDEDYIVVQGGNITEDLTLRDWLPYWVTNGIYVHDATNEPVLTIEDGVELIFDNSSTSFNRLIIGADSSLTASGATLIVDGHTAGVTMTSGDTSPAAGDWWGLVVYTDSDGTMAIDGLTVEYARYGLDLHDVTGIAVTDSTFSDNYHGVYLTGTSTTSTASFDGCTFEDNTFGYGVYAPGGLTAAFTDNLVTGNAYPIALPASQVAYLDTSSTYTGNDSDFIKIWGNITSDTTLDADLGMGWLLSNISVSDASGPVLTIEDGQEIQFTAGTTLTVGAGVAGDLVVAGDWTSGTGVELRGETTGTPGFWNGIYLGSATSSTTSLTGFELRDAGGSTSSTQAGIRVYRGQAALSDCLIEDNKSNGVHVEGTTGTVFSISDCTVQGTAATSTSLTDGDGLYLDSVPEGSLTISDVVITDNDRYPIVLVWYGLTAVDPYSATGSSYSGNGVDYAVLDTMVVNTSGTWPVLDVPWYVDGLYVAGPSSPVLVVDDIEAYMEDYSTFNAGTYASTSGDVQITDSSFSPYDASGSGWCGIWIRSTSAGVSSIDGTTVDGAGKGHFAYCTDWTDSANVVLDAASSVTNSTLSNSSGYGIVCNTTGSTLSGNTYTSNSSGDEDGC